jgi:putative ABC transport system permease protein
MAWIAESWKRLRSVGQRQKLENGLAEEIRFHIDQQTEKNLGAGMNREEARRMALLKFGAIEAVKESTRDEIRPAVLEDSVRDLRHGLRLFGRSPGFTVVALLSLALGIGANTATFTLIEAVILRELPVREPQALVQIVGVVPGEESAQQFFSYPTVQWLGDHVSTLSHVFTWYSGDVETTEGETQTWITAQRVSERYFDGMGVTPRLGRGLGYERDQSTVAVLSFDYWRTRFHEDAGVIGRTVRLLGIPFTIVGVAPKGFFGPTVGSAPDVFIPLAAERLLNPERDLSNRNAAWLPIMGRLAPGASQSQAAASVSAAWPALVEETGPVGQGNMVRWFQTLKGRVDPASTGVSSLRREFRRPLGVLMVVVAVVLLIACVNLSNLLLARSLTRQREIAVRLAIGASRGRVVRQLMIESLLLGVTGAALGLLFGLWSSQLLVSLLSSSQRPISLDIGLNARVLVYTVAVTLLTTVLFGVAPAVRGLRTSMQSVLRTSTHQVIGVGMSSRALLIIQVALSLLLVVGATVFLRTFQNLLTVKLGFDAERVLIARVQPERAGLKGAAADEFYRELPIRLQTVPGVAAAGIASMSPIEDCCWWETLKVEGQPATPGGRTDVYLNAVTPGYFATMGTRLLRGRDFDARDSSHGAPVAIVNESFVRKFFQAGDALGRTLAMPSSYGGNPMQIVGIVEDARYGDLRGPMRLAAYFPLVQSAGYLNVIKQGSIDVMVRAQPGPPLALASPVRKELQALHATIPIKFRSLSQEVGNTLIYERLLALLSAFFGGVAATLVAIGLYGLVSYAVVRRTSEIGLRVALGASRTDVLWMIMRQSLWQVAVGLALGSAAALYLSGFVKTLLFGVQPTDPLTFVIAIAALGLIALLASWLPARRAAVIDPARTLKYE